MLFPVLCLLLLLTGSLAQCPTGYSFFTATEKCFKFVSNLDNDYQAAQEHCEDDGADLASISSSYENSFVLRNIKTCFKFVSILDNDYQAAQEHCEDDGADLASISSSYENSFVLQGLGFSGISVPQLFIGLNKFSGTWKWEDYSSFNYTNWVNGQPAAPYTCSSFNSHTGLWKTANCSAPLPYICSLSLSRQQCKSFCESGWTYFDKTQSCYITKLGAAYQEAESSCQQSGAHLVSIHSDEENNFVYTLAKSGKSGELTDLTWIGMYKTNNVWTNTDGSPTDYFKWTTGQPDNYEGKEYCAQIGTDSVPSWSGLLETYWNDFQCQLTMRAYVCKKAANG